MFKASFSAYNFAISAKGFAQCLRDFWHQHEWSRSHRATLNKLCMCPKPAYMPGMLWRAIALKKCTSQRLASGWLKVTTGMWVRPAPQQAQVCASEPGRSHVVLPLHSLPQLLLQGFRLASPCTGQLKGHHSAVEIKRRCLQHSHHSSGFFLHFKRLVHLLSHMQNLPYVHSPLQNKRFGIKVQSCGNNCVNYLFHHDKRWVNTSFSDMEGLLVSTAKIIFSSGLVFHKATWPKVVCTCDQVTQGRASTQYLTSFGA